MATIKNNGIQFKPISVLHIYIAPQAILFHISASLTKSSSVLKIKCHYQFKRETHFKLKKKLAPLSRAKKKVTLLDSIFTQNFLISLFSQDRQFELKLQKNRKCLTATSDA